LKIGPIMALEDGTDTFVQNVGNKQQSTLRTIPEERRSRLHSDGSLESGKSAA
jgi:hypothetical protein